MTNEEYLSFMNNPLTEAEKQELISAGWQFAGDDYIYLPDDYDGCMASGVMQLRRTLLHIQNKDLYWKHQGKCKDILEEMQREKVKS